MKNANLTDDEIEYLEDIFDLFDSDQAMNLEMVDGFLAALICGPVAVRPSEYLPELWGGDQNGPGIFYGDVAAQKFIDLVMKHWAVIADTLSSGDVFVPLLIEDEDGNTFGNDWANGFLRGVSMRSAAWSNLIDNDDEAGAIIPVFLLAHEHETDPELQPFSKPLTQDRRLELIALMAAGVMWIYGYFEPHRIMDAMNERRQSTHRRAIPKVGRNAPCPCGSGKKSKKCCAGGNGVPHRSGPLLEDGHLLSLHH